MGADISAVVVGTGRMAPGIASALAHSGAQVTVAGRSADKTIRAAGLAGGDVGSCALESAAFRDARLVVETVTEDAQVKEQVYAMLAPWLRRDTVLATNTSGLSITALARGVPRPESFAGLHFLYPADVTPIVEIIGGERTAAETIDMLSDLAARMGKAPIVAHRDVPGFVWNRLQHALLREALWLVDQRVADIATVDAAVSEGLAPRWLAAGPFATVDLGGCDTWSRVAMQLFPHLASDPSLAVILRERSEAGATFYEWQPDALSEVARLRSHAIQASGQVAAARRKLTPAPRSGGPARGQRSLEQRAAFLRAVAAALDADRAELAAGTHTGPEDLPEQIARASEHLRLLAAGYEATPAPPVPRLPGSTGR